MYFYVKFFWSTALPKISSIVNLLSPHLLLVKRQLQSHTSKILQKTFVSQVWVLPPKSNSPQGITN